MRILHAFLPLETKDEDHDPDRLTCLGDIEIKLAQPKTDADGDSDANEADRTISGYGAIFNKEDLGGDVILPGAFKKSLGLIAKNGGGVPILWQHQQSQPIGVWDSLEEDSKGLKCTGTLFGEVPQAQVAGVLIARKAVKGLSIGYRATDYTYDPKTFVRTIKELSLYEISPVTFPMQQRASITQIKNEFQLPSDRELEKALRDAGLSKNDAKAAVAVTKKMVSRDGETTEQPRREGVGDLLKTLRRGASLFS